MQNQNQDLPSDTLESTFSLFFGESEETAGTGTVTRVAHSELADVVVDQAERDGFLAEQRAEADARNAEIEARHRAEAEYYPEEE